MMNESFNLYNRKKEKKKEEDESLFKKLIFSSIIKTLLVIVVFLGSLIYIRQSDNKKEMFKKLVYTNSLSFAKIYNLYNKYLGDVIPFKNTKKDDTKIVSDEKISYSNIIKEKDGYILEVSQNYSVPSIKSGIVIESKTDDTYGNIIKIQDKNSLVITYGNLENLNIKLYDYVEKGEILGTCNNKLYIMFMKDDKALSYEEYL